MNRTIIFAHYDKNNKIEPYVLFLIQKMKEYANKIIFVSDSDIEEQELQSIEPYINKAIIGKHGEYDFGSYKRGYLFCKENDMLNQCDELIFMNDSFYGPLFPLKEMFEEMGKRGVDWWGITSNFSTYYGLECHIQSYFVVLGKKAFLSDEFNYFICSVKKEQNKMDIVKKYEIGLTECLDSAGLTKDVYSSFSKKYRLSYILFYKYLLEKEHVPFIKRCLVLHKTACYENLNKFCKLITRNTDYNVEFIKQDVKLNKQKLNIKLLQMIIYKFFARYFLHFYRKIFINRKVN